MKTRILVVTTLVALVTAGTALAGRKDTWSVVVDLTNRTAYGALGSARNSPDTTQQIGCSTSYDPVNRVNQINCTAVDSARRSAQCVSADPNLVQVSLAIKGDSFVQFWWDGTGACTRLLVDNSSTLAPKQP